MTSETSSPDNLAQIGTGGLEIWSSPLCLQRVRHFFLRVAVMGSDPSFGKHRGWESLLKPGGHTAERFESLGSR